MLSAWNSPVVVIAMMLILGVFILIGAALFGFDKGEFVSKLRENDMARGLITYLFAVTTIGIAIVLVITGLSEGDAIKDQFDRGKDILGLLLGVFGTIVGFYFGSELATKTSKPFAVTPLRLSVREIAPGGQLDLTAYLAGGQAPYEYRVLLGDEVLAEEVFSPAEGWIDASVLIPAAAAPGRQRIRLEVVDQNNKPQSAMAFVDVTA